MTPETSSDRSLGRWLCLLAGAAFVLRLLYILLFVDLGQDYYWEYGEIAKNLHAGNGYALFHAEKGEVSFRYHPEAHPVPSAFMPPGYVMFLYPFFFITDVPLRNLLLLGFQALLGAFLIPAVGRLTHKFFAKEAALFAAGIAAFFPEFVYASSSSTPTVFFHLLIVLLLGSLYRLADPGVRPWKAIGPAAIISVLLVYLRSESVILVFLSAILIIHARGWRMGLALLLVVVLAAMPWAIRNRMVFDEWIPMTTSGGLNLFRGHNTEDHGAWSDSVVDAARQRIPMDASYEPELDRAFRRRVLDIIREDPGREAVRFAEKIWYLWILNPLEPRARHPLYLVPWLLFLGLALFGLTRAGPLIRHLPTFVFLGYSTVVALLFFVLPRYQTMMKVGLIPFAALGLQTLWRRHIDFPRRIE